ILIEPDSAPKPCSSAVSGVIDECSERIRSASLRKSSIILIYGAHLLRNGTTLIIERMMKNGWITHLATNGAGTIHDWEYAWFGASTESVEQNVATGTFGTWDETATNIHRALMVGALDGLGYGRALGRYIAEDGTKLPDPSSLARAIAESPSDPLT